MRFVERKVRRRRSTLMIGPVLAGRVHFPCQTDFYRQLPPGRPPPQLSLGRQATKRPGAEFKEIRISARFEKHPGGQRYDREQ